MLHSSEQCADQPSHKTFSVQLHSIQFSLFQVQKADNHYLCLNTTADIKFVLDHLSRIRHQGGNNLFSFGSRIAAWFFQVLTIEMDQKEWKMQILK